MGRIECDRAEMPETGHRPVITTPAKTRRVVPSLATRWSHARGRKTLRVVPCSWQATLKPHTPDGGSRCRTLRSVGQQSWPTPCASKSCERSFSPFAPTSQGSLRGCAVLAAVPTFPQVAPRARLERATYCLGGRSVQGICLPLPWSGGTTVRRERPPATPVPRPFWHESGTGSREPCA